MKSAGAREFGRAASGRLRLGAESPGRRGGAALLICALTLLLPPPARAQQQARTARPFPPDPEVSVLLSVYADRQPAELTADPAAPFWRDVPGIVLDRRIDTGAPVPALQTEVRSRWTETHLYFIFVCPYEHANLRLDPVTTTETPRLWDNDVLEVHIGANFQDITKYHELQVSPQGEYLDSVARVWYGEFRTPDCCNGPASAAGRQRVPAQHLSAPGPALESGRRAP